MKRWLPSHTVIGIVICENEDIEDEFDFDDEIRTESELLDILDVLIESSEVDDTTIYQLQEMLEVIRITDNAIENMIRKARYEQQ